MSFDSNPEALVQQAARLHTPKTRRNDALRSWANGGFVSWADA